MWPNSSTSSNTSIPTFKDPHFSFENIVIIQNIYCLISPGGRISNVIIMMLCGLIILPVNVLVLYLSYRRPLAIHSDILAVHTSVIDLINVFGSILICCGINTNTTELVLVGDVFYSLNLLGTMCFHTLTSVERYLAVVHPITYLGMKKAKGVRLRKVTLGSAWLISIGGCCSVYLTVALFSFLSIVFVGFFSLLISFFCVSVLCVLNRPGPAKRVGGRQQGQQSKHRAFYTILIILSVMLFRFGGNIVINILYSSNVMGAVENCYLWLSLYWFCLPSDLVLPLLFLHRAGVLACRDAQGQINQ